MNSPSSVDESSFRKLLSRNISLPLGVGVLSAVFFVALITYLLSVIQWVQHTDRVINNVNEAMTLSVDLETGMRGFQEFLAQPDRVDSILERLEGARQRIFK